MNGKCDIIINSNQLAHSIAFRKNVKPMAKILVRQTCRRLFSDFIIGDISIEIDPLCRTRFGATLASSVEKKHLRVESFCFPISFDRVFT